MMYVYCFSFSCRCNYDLSTHLQFINHMIRCSGMSFYFLNHQFGLHNLEFLGEFQNLSKMSIIHLIHKLFIKNLNYTLPSPLPVFLILEKGKSMKYLVFREQFLQNHLRVFVENGCRNQCHES